MADALALRKLRYSQDYSDLLLQELDRTGSARTPVARIVRPTQPKLPSDSTKHNHPPVSSSRSAPVHDTKDVSTAGSASEPPNTVSALPTKRTPVSKGISDLDSLVRDLTDLKGLVGGAAGRDEDVAARIPDQPLLSQTQSSNLRAPLSPLLDNLKRPSEAAGQLERLMDDLSLEAGHILDADKNNSSVEVKLSAASSGSDASTHSDQRAGVMDQQILPTSVKVESACPAPAPLKGCETNEDPRLTDASSNSALVVSNADEVQYMPSRSEAGVPSDKHTAQIAHQFKEPAKIIPGACAACNKPLSGPIVNAMGRAYHPEHFRCHNCSRLLGHGRFFEKEGNAFCEACYQVNVPKCAYCDGPIMEVCITISHYNESWYLTKILSLSCV